MTMQKTLAAAAFSLIAGAVTSFSAHAQSSNPPVPAHNVVLVHGAWADGSSWEKVIPILQAAGLHVTAVQNPLTSLAAADAETRRVLALQDGPTVLVGHSYGGTIISDTGTAANVSALVYVAARAPDADEDVAAVNARFPAAPARSGLVTHDGLTTLSEEAFTQYFASDLPTAQAKILFAVQQPTATSTFTTRTTAAAWHGKPTFYAVAKQDLTISPDLERFFAQRMNATTIEVDSGHLPMISQPEAIANLILQAAGRTR
ncbi:alpha/beta fold hydrolase [Muricoccus vinaceus]|uniref:Alpha/beta fold hydrolase n=1 Tax=Muricoccus vinaceus TaxID=424704 RepID=A0ABV6IV99_9PROT